MKTLLRECAEYISMHQDNDTSVNLLERIDRTLELHDGFAVISEVSREDLETIGYAGVSIDDAMLERIARLMGDDHVEFGGYWESLRKACITEEVPPLFQKEITA